MTKIVKEFALTKEALDKAKRDLLRKWVEEDCARIGEEFNGLIEYVQDKIDQDEWFYIPEKNIYYAPCIVSLVPNLNNTSMPCHDSYGSSYASTGTINGQLEFAGYKGAMPTESEVLSCFGRGKTHFKVGDNIWCNGSNYGGLISNVGGYKQFMMGRYYQSWDIGAGNEHWSILHMPILRLNGINSKPIGAVPTLRLLLEKNLEIEDKFWHSRKRTSTYKKLVNFYQKYKNYETDEEENFNINSKAVFKTILNNAEEVDFIRKATADLLAADTVNNATDYLEELKATLLNCDKLRAGIDAYDENLLVDPNRGHWDLWDWNEDVEAAGKVVLEEGLTARNPEDDVNPGIVAIDFGTKSTVVVYENEHLQTLPLQVGCGNYGHGVQSKNYENPTIVQFIDLESFVDSYNVRAGRPYTKWEEVTVSHTAFENLSNSNSERYYSFFDSLKQWCGSDDQRVKIKDAQGYICDLPPFMDLLDNDVNPVEIYAYYLGLYINNMLQEKHIFMRYIMSFPVTYDRNVRERMRRSFDAGLRKSLPTALLNNEAAMAGFRVQEGASEPAAYAITALEEYGFDPCDDEEEYYAVFDFGGGTTDFDFGVQREAENDRYDYELIHFGANGDKTLGGENLLKLLAFEVFKNNKENLLKPDGGDKNSKEKIPFTWSAEKRDFAGSEGLIKDSQEANLNMHNVMEALRPIWEAPDSEDADDVLTDEEIEVTLFTDAGSQRPNFDLSLENLDLQEVLRERISRGIDNFFMALREAFDKCAGEEKDIKPLSSVDKISIFLAGNSSKSALVQELFEEYLAKDGKARELLGFGKDQPMPEFILYPALGTEAAYELMESQGLPVERENLEKPTGKTGVAFGLLKCMDSGNTKVIDITPDNTKVQFQYYIGRNKKRRFKTVVDRSTKMKDWYKFIDAGGDFDLLYTDQPIAATNEAPVTIAKRIHVTINKPQADAYVYIRPINSHAIEYAIAKNEEELAANKDGVEPITIELE